MIKYLIAILTTIAVAYLTIAFIELEIDFTNWDKSRREFIVVASYILSLVVIFIMLVKEND
jgi:hypothetical protein